MRFIRTLLIVSAAFTPAAHASAHSGVIERHGFALSDVALFVFAALGLWFARRALRARFRRRKRQD